MVTGPKGKGNRPWAKGPWWSPVTIVQAISFSWVNGIINAAEAQAELTEEQARSILPDRDDAPTVAANFEAAYARKKQAYPGLLPSAWFNTTTRALISLYHLDLLKHAFWVCTEVAVRLLSPVALRQFLIYLQQYNARNPLATEYSWHGWLLALALGAGGLCMCIIHHQLFWVGMRVGFLMRQQCIAAVHSKVLRLNASAVSHISQGHVVNLVSNDVRRFDDAIPFWVFLWAGPLELGMVLLMVSLELGILPALAGISATLILIPVQAILVRPVAGIRTATAQRTDERVRLASEVIQGALAMKMLSWEAPFSAALADIRAKEASHVRQMARIRATNMALQFAIMPIVSFATFAVYRALNGSLNVASVFYALSLLSLPKLYMVQFFILGIQSCTELKVSLRRIDAFLSSEEPPLPVVNTDGQSMSSATADAAANAGLSSLNSDVHSSIALQAAKQAPVASVRSAEACHALPRGWVELRGADFDWAQPLGHAGGNGGLSDVGTSGKAAGHAVYEQRSPGGKATEHGTVEQQGSIAAGLKTGDWQTAAKGGNFSADQEAVEQTEESIGTGSSVAGATLQGLRLQLQPGELLAVCGEVGSGKSSLLSALLGELQPLPPLPGSPSLPNPPTGFPHVRVDLGPVGIPLGPLMLGRVAYCAQIPWIVAGTIRDNIVFGSEWDAARYARVLTACALTTDIASLPAGDGTELGERGVNLSGGQKARVALARAAYCQADICLLDDPLSAVDPRVGRVLFGECVRGVMNGRTRVLITHQRQYLGLCDRVLVLRGGRPVAGPAPYKELQGRDDLPELTAGATGAMAEVTVDELVDTVDPVEPWHPVDEDCQAAKQTIPGSPSESAPLSHLRVVDLSEISLATVQLPVAREASRMRRVLSRMFAPGPGFLNEGEAPVGRKPTCTPRMAMFSRPPLGVEKQEVARAGVLNAKSTDGGKLVVQEERQMGVVPWSVYFRYMNNVGPILSGMLGLFLVGGQGVYLASEWWLMLWSQADAEDQSSLSWLLVYGILVAVVFVVSLTRAFMFFEATVSAATRVHNAMAQRVLQAPLSFFHTNPAGRILNRFSKDLGLVDDLLPTTLFDALQVGFLVLSAIVLVAVAVPFILPVFLPMAYVFYVVRRRYLIASREVKRCEATSRSPVFAFFSSTLKGLTTIRAFAAMPRFHEAFLGELSTNGSWWYAFLATSRWIGFRLDLLSAATLLFTALLAMATRDTVSPALLALALTHTLQLTGFMQWFVRQTAEVENNMTSMERMLAYTDLPQEPATVAQGAPAPPEGWPSSGALTYEQVTAVYRPGLPPVLTDISFTLRAGSSCGVVGRTGSGKSSLMLTLFRLIDITSGRIMLDGLDTSCIGLDALRKQLAIIPQDPVLFSGTVRSNLDPWGVHGDMALWDAIGAAALKPAITAAGGLGARMAEAGDNLSVGQRQLFCLARALLQQAKVLALDEATANVDRATDALIQGALREFAHAGGDGRVLLVIAHRLDTVADTDHLLVLDKGVLIESGSPAQLAAQPGGLFASMVKATGHVHLPTS